MGSAEDHLRADGQEACVASVPGDDAFDQVVDGMLSQEDSMSTVELEKVLGDVLQGESMSTAELKKALEELGAEEEVSKKESLTVPDVNILAAIPEASPEQMSARRSKHQAGVVDELVSISAEQHKGI
jgi:hypothetical protein